MLLKLVVRGSLSAVFALFAFSSAFAVVPYHSEMNGDKSALRELSTSLRDGVQRTSSPVSTLSSKVVRVSFAASGLGRVQVVLKKIIYKNWDAFFVDANGNQTVDPKDVILLMGSAKDVHGNSIPVGGSIYNSNGEPVLHLIVNGSRKGNRSYSVKAPLKNISKITARLSAVPSSVTKALTCGNKDDDHHLNANISSNSNVVRAQGTATGSAIIATDADHDFYSVYGANTNAQIATLTAAASAIYESQMGIQLLVGTQHAFTSPADDPYTATDSNTLLAQFQNYTRANLQLGTNAQAYHMFSGKDFDGGVIGLAYVGVICLYPDYAYGITQRYNDAADASILAHELGHNFGAQHDTTDSRSIMAPYVSIPGSTYFSPASIGQIQASLTSGPACLGAYSGSGGGGGSGGAGSPQPTPTPGNPTTAPAVDISASLAKSGVLTLRVSTQVVDGCSTTIYVSKTRDGAGSELYSYTQTSQVTTFSVTGLKNPSRTRPDYLYFSASVSCASDYSDSSVRRVKLDTINKSTKQSLSNVVDSLINAFSSSRSRKIK